VFCENITEYITVKNTRGPEQGEGRRIHGRRKGAGVRARADAQS